MTVDTQPTAEIAASVKRGVIEREIQRRRATVPWRGWLPEGYMDEIGVLRAIAADYAACLPLTPGGWRDMASAPKDGTRITLWREPLTGGFPVQAHWLENVGGRSGWWVGHWVTDATHWVKLSPPSAAPQPSTQGAVCGTCGGRREIYSNNGWIRCPYCTVRAPAEPDAAAVERAARAIAYEIWPHAALDERERWAENYWQTYKRHAEAALAAQPAAPDVRQKIIDECARWVNDKTSGLLVGDGDGMSIGDAMIRALAGAAASAGEKKP